MKHVIINRRQAVTAGAVLLAMSGSGCSGQSRSTTSSSSGTPTTSKPTATVTPKPPARPTDPLTGGKVTHHPVIAVKMENTRAAMPQYGLSPADLVFVEEVEGGLTRLMPVYQSSFPSRVEPVRSARSTDIDILPMFGRPLLVYSGIASQIRTKLLNAPIALEDNGIRDTRRPAPHNLRFDLAQLAKRHGLRSSRDIGLRFGATDARLTSAPSRVDFAVQVGNDRFSFSHTGTHYLPSWNGRPYVDAGAGGSRVVTDNVLVLKVRTVSDGYRDPAGNPVSREVSTGAGALTLYRNGKQLTGTWHRSATNQPFRLRDHHGKELLLTPGKTWILLES